MSLALPIPGATLTQHFANQANVLEFGYWHIGAETCQFNYYPGSTYAKHYHAGTDWAAQSGTPVLAMEAGRVVSAGWATNPGPFAGGGNVVEVQVDGGMRYAVCHLSSINVAVGQSVARGQRLGSEGSTGIATGPHTHVALSTLDSTQRRTFHNPEQFIAGGKYANSPLIQPAALPDTGTEEPMTATYAEIHVNHNPKRVAHFAAGKKVAMLSGLKPDAHRTTFAPTQADAYGTDGLAEVTQDPAGYPSGWYCRINAPGSAFDNFWVALRDITLDPDTPCT